MNLKNEDSLIQEALTFALDHLVKVRPNNPVEFVSLKLREFQKNHIENGEKKKGIAFAEVVKHDRSESQNDSFLDDEDDEEVDEDTVSDPADEEEEEEEEVKPTEVRGVSPRPPMAFSRARRQSVSAETFQKQFAYPDEEKAKKANVASAKTPEQESQIREAISSNFMFKSLEKEQLDSIISAMFEVKKKANENVIVQGDEGDNFYVLAQGTCSVMVSKNRQPATLVKTAVPGDSFGELALMYFCPRAATVKANTDVVLWAVDRVAFRTILMETTLQKRRLYESFLDKVEILGVLNSYERGSLADALEPSTFQPEQVIVRQGDHGDKFYIIESGHAYAILDRNKPLNTIVNDVMSGEIVKEDYGPGDYFGELALLNDKPRACSIVAKTACKVLSLDRLSFSKLLGSCEKLLRRNVDLYQSYSRAIAERHTEIREQKKLKEEFKQVTKAK